tara:strand:- start:3267 stop:3803 length:537 start_codon:yes stop_codon:yes gene_type:complete
MRTKIMMLITGITISCENPAFMKIMGSEDVHIKEINYTALPNLPIDERGYYHLELMDSWQTIHTIGGVLYRGDDITNGVNVVKTAWQGNMYWVYGDYECYIKVVDNIGYSNCVNYDYQPEWLVPTVNGSAYSREDGSVNQTIGPVRNMRGDTLQIITKWYDDWTSTEGTSEPLYIILD